MQKPIQLLSYASLIGLLGVVIRVALESSGGMNYVEAKHVHVNIVTPESAVKRFSEILKFRTVSSHTSEDFASSIKA
jgi:hypothetical protein